VDKEVIPLHLVGELKTVRMEIVETDVDGVPTMLVPAQVQEHDKLTGFQSTDAWPDNLAPSTLKIHMHFLELVTAWNYNPHRTEYGVASVDQFAESNGISRFAFCSRASATAFIAHYELDDFIVERIDAPRSDAFHFITLSNRFLPSEVARFFQVYDSAMLELSAIENERRGATRVDGNKVGFVLVDHFTWRETYQLMRIKQSRKNLGSGLYGRS
jgi:hypothetical protein